MAFKRKPKPTSPGLAVGSRHTLDPNWTPDKEQRKAAAALGFSPKLIDKNAAAFRFFHTKGLGGLWRYSDSGWRTAWDDWLKKRG